MLNNDEPRVMAECVRQLCSQGGMIMIILVTWIYLYIYYIHFGHHPSQGMVLNDDEPMFQTIVSPGLGWWGGVTRGNGC